jgi:hypothetical protein
MSGSLIVGDEGACTRLGALRQAIRITLVLVGPEHPWPRVLQQSHTNARQCSTTRRSRWACRGARPAVTMQYKIDESRLGRDREVQSRSIDSPG